MCGVWRVCVCGMCSVYGVCVRIHVRECVNMCKL